MTSPNDWDHSVVIVTDLDSIEPIDSQKSAIKCVYIFYIEFYFYQLKFQNRIALSYVDVEKEAYFGL